MNDSRKKGTGKRQGKMRHLLRVTETRGQGQAGAKPCPSHSAHQGMDMKYRLLKSIPGAAAGSIFVPWEALPQERGYALEEWGYPSFLACDVEDNSEWFEPYTIEHSNSSKKV